MKKLLTLLFLLITLAGSAANRYATSGDVATYAAVTNGRMTVNDYIYDTPTFTSGGRGFIYDIAIGTTLSSLRFGGTVWFDATSLPTLYNIEIHNNGTLITGKSDADNPVRFCPLGGQIKIFMSSASNTARMWSLGDYQDLEVNGYVPSYPGMKYNWSGPLRGTFGFHISGDATLSKNPFGLLIDGPVGMRTIIVKNIEIEHGYCGLRISPGNTSYTIDKFESERVYIHDMVDGEAFYVLQTTGTPFALVDNIKIRDILTVRTGAEAIQLQHMQKGTQRNYQENFVIWAAAAKWKFGFQQFQASGSQFLYDEGGNTLRNGIIDGWADTGLFTLSSTSGTPDDDPVIIQNILLNDGRSIGVYTGVASDGVDWIYRDLYFRDFNNTWNELTETAVPTYVISENSTDPMCWQNITWDNTKSSLYENQSVSGQIIGTQQDNAMPAPEYRVQPFKDRTAEQVEQWSEEYPSWSSRAGDKTAYVLDDIVACWISSASNAGSYRFYNCISAHTSSAATRPDGDATHWEIITFDEEGDPSYHADWDAGDTQVNYPFDDLRLVSNSTWNLKGMGLSSNERNTNYTYFQWYIDDDGTDSGMQELAGKTKLQLDVSTEDVNRYVRCKAFVKLAGGSIEEVWVNTWVQVN